jgi:hypothetical protein
MKVFKIKLSSLLVYTAASTVILLTGMFLGVYMALTHANDVYFFLLILFGLATLVFIPDLLSAALTEWSITEGEIKIRWLSQFLFQKKLDTTFTLENIEEYIFQPQRRFSFLKIKLRDNTVFKYWHSNSAVEDDFDNFLTCFQQKVTEYNDEGINILHGIKRGKTIYETTYGLSLAIIMAILMISYLIAVWDFKYQPRTITWVYIIPAYSGGIYFISQVISHRKQKKRQQPT